MRETNRYENAIKQGRTIDFFLGRNEYLYTDDDYSIELHTPSVTFIDIEEFKNKYGEERMLSQFKADIKDILRLNLESFEFLYISTYIYIYMYNFYIEKSLKTEWIPDEETKELIQKHYNNFMNKYTPTSDFNYRFPKEQHGYYLHNIICKYKFIKERFGIDLLS